MQKAPLHLLKNGKTASKLSRSQLIRNTNSFRIHAMIPVWNRIVQGLPNFGLHKETKTFDFWLVCVWYFKPDFTRLFMHKDALNHHGGICWIIQSGYHHVPVSCHFNHACSFLSSVCHKRFHLSFVQIINLLMHAIALQAARQFTSNISQTVDPNLHIISRKFFTLYYFQRIAQTNFDLPAFNKY